MTWKFNPPPGWPQPPDNWVPAHDWKPDPSWPAAPEGWQFWMETEPSTASAVEAQAPGQVARDPLVGFRRPSDVWAAIGKPLTGLGAVKVRMDRMHLFVERGVLSTDSQQVPLAWIVDVDASQTPTQKLRGVGNIRVRVNRGGTVETMLLNDLEDFRLGVEVINGAARAARLAETKLQHTQHVNYAGYPSQPSTPPAAPQRPTMDETLSSIERLGRLYQSGALTEDEFNRKKAELLSQL